MTNAVKTRTRKSKGWATTDELLGDIYSVIELLDGNDVDVGRARAYIGLFRVAVKVVAINLEFLKATGNLKSTSKGISGFAL